MNKDMDLTPLKEEEMIEIEAGGLFLAFAILAGVGFLLGLGLAASEC